MRIGINLSQLNPRRIGGMENYARQMIAGLAAAGHQLWLFLPKLAWDTFEDIPARVCRVRLGDDKALLAAMERLQLEVWYCPLLWLEPRFCPLPTAVTIPDLQHEVFPEYFAPAVLAWRRDRMAVSARLASVVFTLSEHAKATLVNTFGIDPDKVAITPCDIGADFAPPEQELVARCRATHGDYLLYPANTWPHKDHQTLLLALAELVRTHPGLRLVLTGSADTHHAHVVGEIARLGLADRVDICGHVPVARLVALYASARALVFPSRFEGFGIPLVEAMHVGCPIVCADATSLPEVAGDAALLFRPGDASDLATQVRRVLDEPALAADLVRRGRRRRLRFRWAASARTASARLEAIIRPQGDTPAPKVTVVTPSYEQARFIRAAIDSVLGQDYPTVEYILVDGGSRDGTVDILREYGTRVSWTSSPDGGQADAVNRGIERARGDIIGWLNSDDRYEPGAIAQAVGYLVAHPETDAVYGDAHYMGADGADLGPYPTEAFDHDRLAETCFVCQPAVFVRRAALIAVGLLDTGLETCMDYDLWLKLSRRQAMVHLPVLMAHSRLYPGNKTLGMRAKVYREIICTVRRHRGYVPLAWYAGLWRWRSRGRPNLATQAAAAVHFAVGNWKHPRRVATDLPWLLGHLRGPGDPDGMGLPSEPAAREA